MATYIDSSTVRVSRRSKARHTFDRGCNIHNIRAWVDCTWDWDAVRNTAREDRSTILLTRRQDNGSFDSANVVVEADVEWRGELSFSLSTF